MYHDNGEYNSSPQNWNPYNTDPYQNYQNIQQPPFNPSYPAQSNFQNPMSNPTKQNWQACRDRCFRLGYTPGTNEWRICVHGCMGS